MSADDAAHAKTREKPQSGARTFLAVPAPIKRIFDRFPLVTYPANALPSGAYSLREHNVLFVFTTPEDAAAGAPSFHPSCLKWQTLLKIYEVPFRTQPSSSHASPTSALPFLVPAAPAPADPVAPSALPGWIRARSDAPARAPTRALHEALLRPVRAAYLHALYLAPRAFERAARRLYVDGETSATVVRDALAWQLRCAAVEEVTGASGAVWPRVDAATVYGEAEEALDALAAVLGAAKWFGRSKEGNVEGVDGVYDETELPGMLDAAVFGYTHVILHLLDDDDGDDKEDAREETDGRRLAQTLRGHGNLVEHRERMLRDYYD